ncbi:MULTISPECIES: ribosomal protein S18-alanine N-acetyltransferase [Acidithiobacillus]|jgi:ribosomal-protein-alanine N-acetyltransferase|uniref:[Ribosomal protein bS18]-alanine N-acetyltransferase n=3 Tax=root TaxID=1 RepID=B7J749_ACIF2|nr:MULTISPECIES: ribosomal protein S18-alanine N-acetyltransferase [Acidithiobacillus]MCL5956350.1 ribosomal protein S18-alanine N-acetyltransferase [Gammaproteobacteria bacterium]ACH84349.1 ribosomal-protein-alanine acetyltransferase [Acidithiobacillus ferrooxidans ATCC 53993]ACK78821.1 ribosomal-protein-alanine acetyltransferase [Acidithiobacillus ferrooxidans ATCC 23270]MBN6743971.1 ribosomal protein S18-alanine N-acetyltransferase [Acidithiobacillus sp. MC2.2]MBN6746864.1 ribosomal protein
MNLRPMRADDLDAVAALESQISPGPWTRGVFRECLQAGYDAWIMENDGGVLGAFGVLSTGAAEAHILNLGVATALRRRGFGRRMLQHLLCRAGQLGAQRVFLEVRVSNAGAQDLYRSQGFHEIGVRLNYYRNGDGEGREDALVLSLSLLPSANQLKEG